MLVKDIMIKNVITVNPNDTLSSALSKMKKYKIHQLPVVENGELYGVVELKKIVTRDIDVSSTKISNIATNTPNIDANANIESVSELLLRAGVRALPVTEGGKVVGIISEADMIKVAKSMVRGLNTKIGSILTPAEYVLKGDTVGKVKSIMVHTNVSRVPVVENSKVIGVVGTMELIRIAEGKERMPARGGRLQEEGAKDKIRISNTPVEAIMRDAAVVSGSANIGDVIEIMKTNEDVVVSYNGSVSVITPKDILELFTASPKKYLYVQITGMQDEDIEFKVKIDQAVREFVKRMDRSIKNIEYLFFHIEKHSKTGKRHMYSIRSRFKTPLGLFVSHANGWDPIEVVQDATKRLEREVKKRYGKMEDMSRMRRQKKRYI